jgi:hypothetical protein
MNCIYCNDTGSITPGSLDCYHCGAAEERRDLDLAIYSQDLRRDGSEAAWVGYGMGKAKSASQLDEARALLTRVYADSLLDTDLMESIRKFLKP